MRPSPQYRAMLRFALFSLLPAAFACAASTASAADRPADPAPAYRDLEGRLSSLEEDLFSDVLDGRLDRFSLFSAALVAGGTRDRGRIAEYEARLDALLKRLRPRVAEKTSELAKAREIFRFMHGEILTGGYRLECSRLSRLLDDGRYNCVSASILYKVLATEFGLEIRGLEVPGHAMCRLVLGGETLEIESTCPRWFSLIDQPAKRESVIRKAMGCSYGSVPATCREVDDIQWLATIYYNRGIDLLSEKDFAGAVGANAKALRLDGTNEIAKGNLLASLNNWAIHLSVQELYATAVEKLDRGLAINPDFQTLHANYAHVHGRWADALCRAGRFAEAVEIASGALAKYPDLRPLAEKRLEVFRQWAGTELEAGRREAAFAVFDRATLTCRHDQAARLAGLESAAVIDAADELLRHGRKADAIALYDAALRRNPDSRSLAANRRTITQRRNSASMLVPVSTEGEAGLRREGVL